MTFYFLEDENVLEGNVIGDLVEVDGIMEEGRGTAKLREIQRQIDKAIIANGLDDDNVDRSAAEAIDEAVEEM